MTTKAADTNNAKLDGFIEEAKQIAREAIRETWPTVAEITESTDGMYKFDAICIDEEECPVGAIAIMHDAVAEMFSLVEEFRPIPATQISIERDKNKPLPAWPIDWERLQQDHEIAFLRGGLATSLPESYTIEEMRVIREAMDASSSEIEATMRGVFNSMSTELQLRMMELLRKVDPGNIGWWQNLLLRQEA